MTDQQDPHREQYDRARSAFDDLKIEDKAVFLLKETMNTFIAGVEHAAKSIVEEFDSMFGEAPAEEGEAAANGNGTAKEDTPPKKTTRSRSTAKKTTARKTTTRKRTTKKAAPDDA